MHHLTGQRFGKLLVLGLAERPDHVKNKTRYWACVCDCGNTCTPMTTNLLRGISTTCGCSRGCIGDKTRTHGLSKSPEYRVWKGMKTRCTNQKNPAWPDYGGRGITICERWRDSFEEFLGDMGVRPSPDHTIERVDNDRGYCPDNCKWIPRPLQARNKRGSKLLEYNGQTLNAQEWSDITGIPRRTISDRMMKVWSPDKILGK